MREEVARGRDHLLLKLGNGINGVGEAVTLSGGLGGCARFIAGRVKLGMGRGCIRDDEDCQEIFLKPFSFFFWFN